jgi:DNA-binding response OmpR family regulator
MSFEYDTSGAFARVDLRTPTAPTSASAERLTVAGPPVVGRLLSQLVRLQAAADAAEPFGHLGLRLDPNRRVAYRIDYPPLGPLNPLRFAILTRLAKRNDTPCNRNTIGGAWTEVNCLVPGDERIDSEVSGLRKAVAQLGLTIKTVRKIGWYLAENTRAGE